MAIMERVLRPALRAREDKRPANSSLPSSQALLKQMWILVATGEILPLAGPVRFFNADSSFIGLSIFLGGFLIWNLDNAYCNTIRRWRHQIQLPWAVVLEGHAWWHLMTGIGGMFDY